MYPARDGIGRAVQDGEVDRAARVDHQWNDDDDHVRGGHRGRGVNSCFEPAGRNCCGHGLFETGLFVDVGVARVDGGHHVREHIAADDVQAFAGKLRREGQPDLAEAHHRDCQRVSLLRGHRQQHNECRGANLNPRTRWPPSPSAHE